MTADEREAVRRRFRDAGIDVTDAVPAFSGVYPRFGGCGNMEYFLSPRRLLALYSKGIGLWVAYTGPTPTKHLTTVPVDQLKVVKTGRRRYDRVALGGQRLWVHRRYRETLERWIERHGTVQS